ncbi:hypothetical protein ACRRTK_013654 [Alexandromys fortis]
MVLVMVKGMLLVMFCWRGIITDPQAIGVYGPCSCIPCTDGTYPCRGLQKPSKRLAHHHAFTRSSSRIAQQSPADNNAVTAIGQQWSTALTYTDLPHDHQGYPQVAKDAAVYCLWLAESLVVS